MPQITTFGTIRNVVTTAPSESMAGTRVSRSLLLESVAQNRQQTNVTQPIYVQRERRTSMSNFERCWHHKIRRELLHLRLLCTRQMREGAQTRWPISFVGWQLTLLANACDCVCSRGQIALFTTEFQMSETMPGSTSLTTFLVASATGTLAVLLHRSTASRHLYLRV